MALYLIPIIFFGLPAIMLVLFAVGLILYLTAKHRNKRSPGTYTDRQLKMRLTFLIVSGSIAGCMLIVVISLIALLFMAVAFM